MQSFLTTFIIVLLCFRLVKVITTFSFHVKSPANYFTTPKNKYQDCSTEEKCRNRYNLNMKMFRKNDSCFYGLGCFSNSPPWYTPTRPARSPWAPNKVCTKAILTTRKTLATSLQIFPFISPRWYMLLKQKMNTTIICHGFYSTAHEPWVTNLTHALLERQDQNVIAIDWGKGAGNTYQFYFQSLGNCRVVGAIMTKLVIYLIEKVGITPEQIHLIGHSLGAHCVAYVGKALNGSIGRLTGLDPAGPYFTTFPDEIRMNASDAKFTDVIHTNTGISGIFRNVGHCDFYMNLGVVQPDCPNKEYPSAISCAHQTAPLFYSSAVRNPHCFLARPASFSAISDAMVNSTVIGKLKKFFHQKKCKDKGSECVPIGLETCSYKDFCSTKKNETKNFIAFTDGKYPYCKGEW